MSVFQKRALFLDRDGVVNYDSGYTSSAEKFKFINGIFDLCRAAMRLDYLLIVVTNQAGIGRGYYSEQDFLKLTEWMNKRFEDEGVLITDVYYCPYHPEHGVGYYKKESFDRKPNPGMLLRAAQKYQINLAHSIMIGDKESDMLAAFKAGVGARCHYRQTISGDVASSSATHEINSLQEGCVLVSAWHDKERSIV